MTAIEKEQAAPYTARNRDRFTDSAPDYGRAARHLSGKNLDQTLRESLRRSAALRASSRAARMLRARESDNPTVRGLARIEQMLHGVNEAENFDVLLYRQHRAAGMIEGAQAFDNITAQAARRLGELLQHAYSRRLRYFGHEEP